MDKRSLYSLISSIFGRKTNIKTEGGAVKAGDKDSDGPVESMVGEKGGASKSGNDEEIVQDDSAENYTVEDDEELDLSFLDD